MTESPSIMDATAGNRLIWATKKSPHILWIDIESELQIPADRIIDCTNTKFPDESLFTIFFDPPHRWGHKLGEMRFAIRNESDRKKYAPNWKGGLCYYGTDKYKTKAELLNFIHRAQKEFFRILTPNGMLWVKWNEMFIPLQKILSFFRNWDEMMKIYVGSPYQTNSVSQSYWLLFMKQPNPRIHLDLSEYMTDSDTKEDQT